ncbi:cation:proton antiporter [Legionella bononiensis]|uniref:Sodium:proton antiporter n=1 Tax=Legionella bononiensis TaxID=2793102 RepID=A0ABS1WBZ4_9GAMM|nr:sodium:proton antiporter [Legionella bononiensis]MBL7481173.1 sodium:proton antiporter [Legionella bononiensis]MBL7526882.1 sodium:proton antiporter [Legionella bononiensis]MBL7563796.1 sodium:proton antiporter [Legionella bononiensis]
MAEHALLLFALVLITGLMCQWLAWRLKIPVIIFLLVSGIIEGPILNWLNPDKQLGAMLNPFISLSAAIILFEGSLTLKFKNIPGLERVIQNLITFGAMLTWVLIALATHFIFHFTWAMSFLFAAIMVVTGPTVIIPMLKILRPNANIANVLQWEGILIDPLGALLAVLVFEYIISDNINTGFWGDLLVFCKVLLISVGLGISSGFAFGTALRKYWIPEQLQNFAVLTLVCGVFAVSNYLVDDSGLLTVTLMGICLANIKNIELDDILNFKESLSVLLISFLFIILAARINLATFISLGWPALALFAVIQFIIRPINVYLSSWGSKLTLNERHLIAWIAPRGIIAAAISAIFALKLENLGNTESQLLVPLTFFIIVGTVLLQSITAKFLAIKLKVAEPKPKGFLIIGANSVAQAIAKQLVENTIYVCLADQDWSLISSAKMNGLTTYWGNPVSMHAEDNINLMPIKHLLVMTPQLELNILAAKHYRQEFGSDSIFTIRTTDTQQEQIADKIHFKHGGRIIFGQDVTFDLLHHRINSGAKIKTTLLTEQYTYDQYLATEGEPSWPLFAIDPNNAIYVFTVDARFIPTTGWKIIGIGSQNIETESN